MIYFMPVSGLCNRMRALDSVVSLCGETGNPLRVYWVKDPIMNCAFADLFQPIPGLDDFGIFNDSFNSEGVDAPKKFNTAMIHDKKVLSHARKDVENGLNNMQLEYE